jgi:hypothetical protein
MKTTRFQIRRISYLQNIKLLTLFYFLIGCIYIPVGVGVMIFAPDKEKAAGIVFLFMPILMAVFGAVFIGIFIALYNIAARFLGGFEFTLEEKDTPPPVL